jgi:NAD(P)H dehydrogenase (quinone)
MNILIIYSHPSQKSYTFQILEQLRSLIRIENRNLEISDLYEMGFQSDMTEAEYEREGFANLTLPLPADVLQEHQKIENADCILFLYPVWWSDCPAKMKGWFDRVYSVGYAYGNDKSNYKMKTIKLGLAICTAGHSNDFLEETGIAKSMRTVFLDDRLGKRFENKEMLILGGTLDIEKVRAQHQQQIESVIEMIKKHCNFDLKTT